MMNFLRKNTLNVEIFSIDEAFCDITGLAELNNLSLRDYIKKIQKDIIKYI
jgi:nucleotidyltransferase/DNA polymerase involved in DNA repair